MERLDKILAHLGYGSRKEVKGLIRKGFVKVNDEVVYDDDYKIDDTDCINVYDEDIIYDDFVYYLLNKPKGYLSATISINYPTVLDLLPYRKGLFPIGRLDLDTEGLLIITNDGNLAHNLINPKKEVEKEYYFKYSGKLVENARELCLKGININNEYITKSSKLEIMNDFEGKIILTEGKYHEVKRIIKYLGGEVTYLKRIRIKNLELGDLGIGSYRELTKSEILDLYEKNEKN